MTSPIKGLTEALRAELEATPGGLFVADIAAKHGRAQSGVTATLHHLMSQGYAAKMASPTRGNHRRLRWYAPQNLRAALAANTACAGVFVAPVRTARLSDVHAAKRLKPTKTAHQWTHDKRYQLSPAEAQAFKGEFSSMGIGRYVGE